MTTTTTKIQYGNLALAYGGLNLPVQVMTSAAGFYLGTLRFDESCQCDMPYSRESIEYWKTQVLAESALREDQWTQKKTP